MRSETDDFNRALKIVEDQRKRGYKAWIEDENGREVDEETLKKNGTQKPLYERRVGILIWGTAAAVAIGSLYACSLLAGD